MFTMLVVIVLALFVGGAQGNVCSSSDTFYQCTHVNECEVYIPGAWFSYNCVPLSFMVPCVVGMSCHAALLFTILTVSLFFNLPGLRMIIFV